MKLYLCEELLQRIHLHLFFCDCLADALHVWNLIGSVHLADFSILGFLNYRNDSEGNDGLGGSYGTGSSISRIWVEHTKAAAWILNSSGLVVDGCRFRNTLADGVNLDFEPIVSGQSANFVTFVRTLRAELDKINPGYELVSRRVMPDLDANANAVAIQHIKLENEGWERDYEVPEPAEPTFVEPQ